MADTKNQDDALRLLQESLASDLLTDAVSKAEVDLQLREAGGDPVAIRARGAALAERLLEQRRLSWQDAARKKLAAGATRRTVASKPQRTRDQMLDEIGARRAGFERRGVQVATAFRKRKPEEASDEELAEFLDELEMLEDLHKDDGTSDE